MKTILAALAVSIGLVSVALPASAGYVNPNSSRVQQSFQHGD